MAGETRWVKEGNGRSTDGGIHLSIINKNDWMDKAGRGC